jgi:uncharacterized protein (TIGR02391 family)
LSVSRPLPKSLLKKMFVKILDEHKRPGGIYQGHGWSSGGIISKISEYFKIPPLTGEEKAECLRAVYELERDGFIMQDSTQSSVAFKILTSKGKTVVEKSLEEMKLPSVDIDQIINRDDLREKVHDDYLVSDYETGIFKAFRLVEERVRAKAALPPDCIGADLMTKAFKPNGGIFKHPNAKTAGEEEALHLLMRGAIMWFKNPSSHRTVGYDDDVQAAHVLGFANLLLDLVDECQV